ncbi:MAG: cytochrome c5 family protein [Bacteroidetes bacterium]|nr:cytochrome c5 family protein [Bacteroidota bacterium]
MKIFALLYITSFALLAGCDGKDSRTVSSSTLTTDTPISQNASAAASPIPSTSSLGENVYKSTCSICHQSGLRSAPKMGSARDWEPRLAQGKETLYKRALNGYRGEKGSMPSRGSNAKLSEDEVKAAVDYMYEHAIPAWDIGK